MPFCVFFLLFFNLVCEAIGTAATPGLLCQISGDSEDDCGEADGIDWQGKLKFSEKTCPSATFFYHKIPHEQTRV
jgi:hypothetical protein